MKVRCKLTVAATVVGAFCLILCCAVGTAFGQATTGTILGRVSDAQDAAIPGAEVTARETATNISKTIETNGDGNFVFYNLPPGIYTLTVTRQGFSVANVPSNKLEIDQRLRLDVRLTVGDITESVTVEAEAQLLQTESAETGQVVDTQRINDLPLLGRNFLALTALTTGVTGGAGGNPESNISINGQRETGNSILVDGVEVTSNRNNDVTLRPSLESVREFKVITSAYAPEFGRASGGVISIQTKGGSNRVYGSLFEYIRPNGIQARPWRSPTASGLKQNNFGGSIGGPLPFLNFGEGGPVINSGKDKTFFFASYEGERRRDLLPYLGYVPERGQINFLPNGDVDLSRLLYPYSTNPNNTVYIYNPNTFIPYANNIIPANQISPAGRQVLQRLFPAPTNPNSNTNYISAQNFSFDQNSATGRIDHVFSDRDRIAGVYNFTNYDYLLGDPFAGRIGIEGGGAADVADNQINRAQALSITETHNFTASVVNEFRFGYNRFRLDQLDLTEGRTDLATQLGIRNINLPGFPQTQGLPQFQLQSGVSTGGSTFKPLYFLDSNFQFVNNLSFNVARHNLKTGVDVRSISSRPGFSLFPSGYFYFSGALSGSEISDLLLGLPEVVNLGLQYAAPKTTSREFYAYGQDSWQVSNRLTLVYGLRYELRTPYREEGDNAANFDPQTLTLRLAGRGENSRALVNTDTDNFAPRVGASFRLDDKTVLRAGYGVFYTAETDARNEQLTFNYPFAERQEFFNFSGGISYTLDAGVPRNTAPRIPNGATSIDARTIPNARLQSLFFIDPNFKTGRSQNYNVVLQRELFKRFVVEAGYVGATTTNLSYGIGNINRDNRLSNRLGNISGQYSLGESSYNSLQLKADKRFSDGYGFLAAYTFSKLLDNGNSPLRAGAGGSLPQDPFNLDLERAPSILDARHNFVGSFTYALPFGKGKRFLSDLPPVLDAIFGGFQINGIFRYRSGLPVNVLRFVTRQGYGGLRPDVVRDPNLPADRRTPDRWFDTTAFSNTRFLCANPNSQNCAQAVLPGNAGRNIVRGPNFRNLDFSAFKQFPLRFLSEAGELEVRFEFFNVFNTVNLGQPGNVVGRPGFGQITSAGSPRIVQFAARINF